MTDINAYRKDGTVQPVTVNLGKLMEGVSTVFAGAMQMLEAFEVHAGVNLNVGGLDGVAENAKGGGADAVSVKENVDSVHTAVGRPENAQETKASVESDVVPTDDCNITVSASLDEEVKKETQELAAVSGLTKDDITKIIVQKIKQNRSNNAKIGSILKTYGVTKVSELPAEKYEAFVTDLSQI